MDDNQDIPRTIDEVETDFNHWCQEIGWRSYGAIIHEVANVLRYSRELEQIGGQDVWKRVVDLVETESYAKSPQYLVDWAKVYAQGIKDGIYLDLDKKSGSEANSQEVFNAVSKLEKLLPIN